MVVAVSSVMACAARVLVVIPKLSSVVTKVVPPRVLSNSIHLSLHDDGGVYIVNKGGTSSDLTDTKDVVKTVL